MKYAKQPSKTKITIGYDSTKSIAPVAGAVVLVMVPFVTNPPVFLFRLLTTNLPKNQKFSSHIRTKCIRTRIPTRKMQTCSYRLLFDFRRNSYYFVAISLLPLIPDFDTTHGNDLDQN